MTLKLSCLGFRLLLDDWTSYSYSLFEERGAPSKEELIVPRPAMFTQQSLCCSDFDKYRFEAENALGYVVSMLNIISVTGEGPTDDFSSVFS
jgi:hypothetical protein